MRNRSDMSGDPFSDILEMANARSVVTGGFTAGGRWSLRFPVPGKLKFFAVVEGECWLSIDGDAEPVRIETGDVFMLGIERSFVLAKDLSAPRLEAKAAFEGQSRGMFSVGTVGNSDDAVVIGGHVQLDPSSGRFLTDVLPPLVHVKASSPEATSLQWILDQLVRERMNEFPGSTLASSQLAQLMFVQLLRAHLASSATLDAGWLRAMTDPRIAPALRLMHDEPGRPWRLSELAGASGMSRTTFAVLFKSVSGLAPLAYLTEWRMKLARKALRTDSVAVSELARSLGYTSESAFSNAFKRATGHAPLHFRNRARGAAEA